jgi:hypothetical protein
MKKLAAVVLAALALTGLTIAADEVVTITVTIPDAHVAEMVNVIRAHPDRLMTLQTNVVDGVTNVTRVVVAETPRNKFTRITKQHVLWYWKDIVARYRAAQQTYDDLIEVEE